MGLNLTRLLSLFWIFIGICWFNSTFYRMCTLFTCSTNALGKQTPQFAQLTNEIFLVYLKWLYLRLLFVICYTNRVDVYLFRAGIRKEFEFTINDNNNNKSKREAPKSIQSKQNATIAQTKNIHFFSLYILFNLCAWNQSEFWYSTLLGRKCETNEWVQKKTTTTTATTITVSDDSFPCQSTTIYITHWRHNLILPRYINISIYTHFFFYSQKTHFTK